jgi:hypothetical protein
MMSRTQRPVFLILIVTASVTLSTALAAAPSTDVPMVSIGIDDYGNVPVGQLTRAQGDVAQAYCDVGVEIAWRQTRHLSPLTPPAWTRFLGLTIIILSHDMVTKMAPPPTALGTTPATVDGPGHIAYVFYSRLATINVGNVNQMLGLVIAHEIGHLLLPYGSDSGTGIMRGQWGIRTLRRVGLHALGFTPFQAQEIRRRASAAAASGQ